MKRACLAFLALGLAGCVDSDAREVAAAALDEAERANARASDLEYEVDRLKREVSDLESDRPDREMATW